jgi:hypothetical protein
VKPLQATGLVPAPREDVFAFLSALENHWAVTGRWIHVVSLDRAVGATGGCVRISGPLGLHRTAATRVVAVEAPHALTGTAQIGSTVAEVSWKLTARGPAVTEVELATSILHASALDRVLLAIGGAAWMRRLLAGTLATLAERFAAERAAAPVSPALSSARA